MIKLKNVILITLLGLLIYSCDHDKDGFSKRQGDCNDKDPSVFPGAMEICGDSIDQDCDGEDLSCYDFDNDKDGYTENQGDCNDSDPSIHPGAEEICCDGIDQNCDGIGCIIDEGSLKNVTWGKGIACSDTYSKNNSCHKIIFINEDGELHHYNKLLPEHNKPKQQEEICLIAVLNPGWKTIETRDYHWVEGRSGNFTKSRKQHKLSVSIYIASTGKLLKRIGPFYGGRPKALPYETSSYADVYGSEVNYDQIKSRLLTIIGHPAGAIITIKDTTQSATCVIEFYEIKKNIKEQGVCWSDTSLATIDNKYVKADLRFGKQELDIHGLESFKRYYFRPYAISAQEKVYYGPEMAFYKHGTFTDNRDGQTYKTFKFGNQIWMAENLNYETSSGSWVYYNDSSYASIYGRLYNWETAKNVCPNGWHLPTDDEWKQLEMAIGMSQNDVDDFHNRGTYEGLKLKATSGWDSNGNGTDYYGFTALPGGRCRDGGSYFIYEGEGGRADFWSSYTASGYSAWGRALFSSYEGVQRGSYNFDYGCSVRCIKD